MRSRAECALLFAALAAMAHEGVGVPSPTDQDGAESVLRVAWTIQELCAARGLTPTESAIVPLLITGETDAVIAEKRGVARSTVANQAAAVYRKLGINSRFELAREMTRAMSQTYASA